MIVDRPSGAIFQTWVFTLATRRPAFVELVLNSVEHGEVGFASFAISV